MPSFHLLPVWNDFAKLTPIYLCPNGFHPSTPLGPQLQIWPVFVFSRLSHHHHRSSAEKGDGCVPVFFFGTWNDPGGFPPILFVFV